MSNILRTQAKLDQTFDKLGALGTDEAKQPLFCLVVPALCLFDCCGSDLLVCLRLFGSLQRYQADIKNHRTAIMTLHDKMADLKSYFDGKGDMTPEFPSSNNPYMSYVYASHMFVTSDYLKPTYYPRTHAPTHYSDQKPVIGSFSQAVQLRKIKELKTMVQKVETAPGNLVHTSCA